MDVEQEMEEQASRARQRAHLIPDVARLLRRHDFRVDAAEFLGREHQYIIVALEDDRVGYVFDQLEQAPAGSGLVVMPHGPSWAMAILCPASPARIEVAEEDDVCADVHEDTEVSMLFEYLHRVDCAVVRRISARLIARDDDFERV